MPDFLYIHIPFCIRKCIYCDFFSVPYEESLAKGYIEALCKELRLKKGSAKTLKTVYIGGGTPSVLPDGCIKQLSKTLRDNFHLSSNAEVTVEINPGTIDGSKIDALLSLGVNRLSIGIQSFNDDELRTLGRIHSSGDALRSIELIRAAGIKNFSMDLMYGIPGQTIDSWHKSGSTAIELSPAHISAYELTPEGKTPLYGLIKSSRHKMPDEELILEMYNHAVDYLASYGYEHYEISNFALPGFRCIHNLNYWDRGEYIGAGAGAHSFFNGVRSRNTVDIRKYVENLSLGIIPEAESDQISPEGLLKEFIFLGLRKREGININSLRLLIPAPAGGEKEWEHTKEVISRTSLLSFPQAKRVGNPSEKKDSGHPSYVLTDGMTKLRFACGFNNDRISNFLNMSEELFGKGYLQIEKDHLKLTRKGILISNTIIVRLFERLGL